MVVELALGLVGDVTGEAGVVSVVRLKKEAVPVYFVSQTAAAEPLVGGELLGPENALKSALVMIDKGPAAAASLGMGAICIRDVLVVRDVEGVECVEGDWGIKNAVVIAVVWNAK